MTKPTNDPERTDPRESLTREGAMLKEAERLAGRRKRKNTLGCALVCLAATAAALLAFWLLSRR